MTSGNYFQNDFILNTFLLFLVQVEKVATFTLTGGHFYMSCSDMYTRDALRYIFLESVHCHSNSIYYFFISIKH